MRLQCSFHLRSYIGLPSSNIGKLQVDTMLVLTTKYNLEETTGRWIRTSEDFAEFDLSISYFPFDGLAYASIWLTLEFPSLCDICSLGFCMQLVPGYERSPRPIYPSYVPHRSPHQKFNFISSFSQVNFPLAGPQFRTNLKHTMSVSSCCLKGFEWEGTPTGIIGKLADNESYIVGDNPDAAVMLIHDLLSWKFPNIRLLADHYAREANVTVYVPDFFGGESLPFAPIMSGNVGAIC